MAEKLTETFLLLFCEKNSDGTRKLRLKGKELEQRIGFRLNYSDLEQIVVFLEDHPEVNELNLCYNEIEDEGLKLLCDCTLSNRNFLEHLNIMHCDITDQGIQELCSASELNFLNLKTLKLTGNKLGIDGGVLIASLIQNYPNLEYLDLGETDQIPYSINLILNTIRCINIKILNISRVLLKGDSTDLAESISEFFQMNNTIVEFHAQKCELRSHDIETIILGLKYNTSLRFLDLGYNNISCVGVEFLADWLKTRPNLLGLNIAGNSVRDHGAVALSFGMPFSKLRFLDISNNKISNEGIVAILNSIKKPYMLRFFYFWGNELSHPGNKIIKRMLVSGVLQQEYIDVKIYCVDGVLYSAYYPADHYKHRYYEVMDYGCVTELKIKRNRIEKDSDKPRALVKIQHVDRFPPLE